MSSRLRLRALERSLTRSTPFPCSRTLKQEMGGQLRELFEVMGVLGSSGGGQDEASSLAGDKERLWNEFEHKFSVWHG